VFIWYYNPVSCYINYNSAFKTETIRVTLNDMVQYTYTEINISINVLRCIDLNDALHYWKVWSQAVTYKS